MRGCTPSQYLRPSSWREHTVVQSFIESYRESYREREKEREREIERDREYVRLSEDKLCVQYAFQIQRKRGKA